MASDKICSIEGCGKRHVARGWCNAHWQRWKDHGDPMAGVPLRRRALGGEVDRWLREIAIPYSGDECLIWPYAKDSDGYGSIRNRGVHRVVCEEVNGERPTLKHEAAHSCGNGHLACCAPSHLRWATHAENMADAIEHGTFIPYGRHRRHLNKNIGV
jgi:hypothetical protein